MKEPLVSDENGRRTTRGRSCADIASDNLDRLDDASSQRLKLTGKDREGIKKALQEVESQHELDADGLSHYTFFIGVVNVVLTTYLFAKHPGDLWVFYGVEVLVFVPAWWYKHSTENKGVLFILDFCWFSNVLCGVYMVLTFFKLVPPEWQCTVFLWFFSCSLGPMSWACIVLSSPMVFHSLDKTASLFVHFTPTLVCYTVLHFGDELQERWPGRFPTVTEVHEMIKPTSSTYPGLDNYPLFFIDNAFMYGWSFYFLWWCVYFAWLCTIGVYLPDRGNYNTVFGNIYQRANLGKVLSEKTGFVDIRAHGAIYMVVHLLGSSVAFFWPPACLRNGGIPAGVVAGLGGGLVGGKNGALLGAVAIGAAGNWIPTHWLWILIVFFCAAWNGAKQYDFLFAQKYAKIMQIVLEDHDKL